MCAGGDSKSTKARANDKRKMFFFESLLQIAVVTPAAQKPAYEREKLAEGEIAGKAKSVQEQPQRADYWHSSAYTTERR